MERRKFRRRVQQGGEIFDDFLVFLRELAKTCNFCSDTCTQKNIRDQTIEGLLDGDIVEDLLKEKDLSLQSTVAKCRAHEAAKRQRAEIVSGPADTAIQTLHVHTCIMVNPQRACAARVTVLGLCVCVCVCVCPV